MTDITIPVLIVGGGPAGLTASILLSSYGVKSLTVNRRPETSRLPKAHILNQRTMEIFREVGLEEEVCERAAPAENFHYFGWYAGLAGGDNDHGRQIGRLECWGKGGDDTRWKAASACRPMNLPQSGLEPLLKRRAELAAPDGVRFNHEVISLAQDGDGVTAVIEDRTDGSLYKVRARYVLACDGGRSVGKMVGVEMEGARNLGSNVTVHMTADLSRWARDSDVLLRWILNPDGGETTIGVLCPMGPTRWGIDSEEWVFHWLLPWGDPRIADDAAVLDNMRRTLGLPDFDPEVHAISRWTVEGLVAARYQVGRVFLLGDAAHRHPPTGALGMNTAVQDSYNICWKLAAVLRAEASPSLLDTYEAERKPVGTEVVARSLENFARNGANIAHLQLTSSASPEQNWARVRSLWADTPEGRSARSAFEDQLAGQAVEYNALNLEVGYRYVSTAIVADGSAPSAPRDRLHLYEPSTQPGAPLPHAWVMRHGQQKALVDLTGRGHFVLIVGEEGGAWIEAALRVAEARRLPLKTLRVGTETGDWIDFRFSWKAQREISASGAILVRPDRMIAWRHPGAHAAPDRALEDAFVHLLGEAPHASSKRGQVMTIARVEDIAFVRFRAPDLQEMLRFGADFGFVPAQVTDDAIYFRGTSSAPFVHVTTRGEPAFDGIGFRASEQDVRALASRENVAVADLATPGGGVGVQLADPDGLRVEVVANTRPSAELAVPDRERTNDLRHHDARSRIPKRVVTGPAHVARLGHCVLAVTDFRTSEAWYKERFGFVTSHEIVDEEGMLGKKGAAVGAFLRCDRGAQPSDHHTLFLLGTGKPSFHHAAFEVQDLDDLMAGHSHLKARERQQEWGVGRHLLGSQIFDYWRDPWGHTVEHWTDGDVFTADDAAEIVTMRELFAAQWGPDVPPGMRG